MEVVRSRNIFIDSEQYHTVNGERVIVNFPANSFHALDGEHMKLTLTAFEMRKNFYNINSYNNKLYMYDNAGGTYSEIVIPAGDYYRFGSNASVANSLCEAIYTGLDNAGFTPSGTSQVTYDINTRKISINMTGASNYTAGDYFVTFQVPRERQSPIAAVSSTGIFNDSYEILGTRPTRYTTNVIPAFDFDAGTATFTSYYPASLYSMEALYLKASIQTNNYCTPTFGADTISAKLIPTQIFARIPIPYADMFEKTQDQPSIIKFEDTNDLFTIYLQQNQIDTVNFTLVDGKGRLIEEVSDNQADDGALAFKFVMRWDVIKENKMGIPIRDLTDRIDQLFRRTGLN